MYKQQFDHGIADYQSQYEIDPRTLPSEYTPAQPSGIDPNKRLSDLTQAELQILKAYSDARKFAQIVLTLSPGDMNGNSLSNAGYTPLVQLSSVQISSQSSSIYTTEDVSTAAEVVGGIQPYKPKMLQLTNLGNVGVFLGMGTPAVLNTGYYMPAGAQVIFTGLDIPKCDVFGIVESGTAKIVIGLL